MIFGAREGWFGHGLLRAISGPQFFFHAFRACFGSIGGLKNRQSQKISSKRNRSYTVLVASHIDLTNIFLDFMNQKISSKQNRS